MTRRVLTPDKGAGYKVDKHSDKYSNFVTSIQLILGWSLNDYVNSMQVGSTVLLKTSNYPNKAIVAYATLLSSSPKAQAGGVEIEKQF